MNTLILTLALTIISVTANAQSLLSSIDLHTPSKSLHEIVREIKLHAHKERSFFSLGESHLQASTTTPINSMLAFQYLDALSEEAVFCTENISSFLKSQDGLELQKRVSKTKLMNGNSPTRTDFKKCLEDSQYYLTYSGFFHQFPFARSFPLEFPQTPVITQDDNTIMDQMMKSDGMFISQIELDFLEMTASTAFLRNKDLSVFNFRILLKKLNQQVTNIKSSMEKLLDQGLKSQNKFGVFISHEQIKTTNLNMPKNSYLLLTELESRLKDTPSFLLLTTLSQLNPAKLKRFIDLLQNSKFYFTKDLMEPTVDGSYSQTGYGTLPRSFAGKSEFLDIKSPDKHFVIVAEPKADEPTCFVELNDNYNEVDCGSLF